LKRKNLAMNEKVKIIQKVEEGSTMSHEIVKCFMLPPSSLSNIILWKASVLEEER
jgi:hypothetical protein